MGSAIERLQKRLYGKTSSTTNTAKNQDSAVKRVQDMVYHGKPFTVNEERSYVAQAAAKRKDVLLDTVVETAKKGKEPTVTSKLDTKTGRTSGGISSGRRAKTVESGSGGRSGRETFSPVKLGVGAMTKGADQFVSGLTSTAAWLEDNTLGRLFPGSTEDTPIDALNRYFQGVKAANEKTFAPNVAAGGKVAKAVDKYGTAAAAAIPQAALALMTAGGSAGASAASAGMKAAQASPGILAALKTSAGAMAKNPQFWMSFLQTAGNSYEQARADGAGETEASLYALANSLAGAGVEIGGGIQTLPGKLAEGGGTLRSWVRSMIEEGREEVVQGAIERGLQNLTYDRGRPLASLTDPKAVLNPKSAAEEFTGGAVVGGLLGGGQALVSRGLGKLAQNGPGAPAQSAGAFGQDGGAVDATGAQDGAQGVPGQNKTAPEVGAVNENGLNAFSEQERVNLSSGKKNKVVSTYISKGRPRTTRDTMPGTESAVPVINAQGEPSQKSSSIDSTIPQSAEHVNSVDPLLKLMLGGKRVDQSKASNEQFAALAERGDVGVDAAGRIYQVDPAQHIDRREMGGVAERSMNAFQFDHPELHGYYQKAAEALIADADLSLQFPIVRSYERGMQGNKVNQKVQASAHLRRAMDETGLTRAQIIDAAERIIHDRGQENVKAAKQVELILDAMLSDGWITMAGDVVFADRGYLAAKEAILGSQPMAEDSYLPEGLDALPGEADGGMMGETAEQEGAYGRDENDLRRGGVPGEGAEVQRKGVAEELHSRRDESRDAYLARLAREGRTAAEFAQRAYGFRRVNQEDWTQYAADCCAGLRAMGLRALVIDGPLSVNQGGVTWESAGDAVTAADGTVYIRNETTGFHASEIVGHEGFHALLKQGDARAEAYFDAIMDQLDLHSRDALEFIQAITDAYFPNGYDLTMERDRSKFFDELSAYVSGMMGDGADLSFLFQDYGAVKAAWERMMAGARNDGLGAADAGFDPYSRLQNQTDRFHPEGPSAARAVEVPMEDFDGRKIPKSASTVMGAQGTTDDGVRALERQIAAGELSFDTIHDADAVGRARETVRGKGFDGALEQYRQAVSASIATKDNTALGQQLLLQAMREGNAAAAAELLALYTRNSTTAAQAMQAQSIFRRLSPEGQLTAVQRAVSALNEKHGTDVELDPEDVADFLNAQTDEERREVTERMVQRAAQSVPGTFRARFDTLRYLAMLGNPRTHIRNILGNTLFQVPVAVKNRVGAVAEAAASAATGGRMERTKSLFGANPLGKLAAEARADWANVKDFLGQSGKYQDGQTSLWDIEQRADAFSNNNPLGRGINRAADFNSRALEAEDTAAKKWIYTQSLAGYLQANGCKSMADADPALLNRARDYAAREALRNTFNDKNAFSDAVSKLGGMTHSDNPFIRGAGYITEGVLPFKRTPANIAVRAVEYSPVGAVLGAVETVRGIRSGDMTQAAAGLDRVAAGVSGSALLAAGFLAAGAGYVVGGGDDDEKQAAFDDLTGHQNYALELPGGRSITLDWLAPEAIPFFMGVELYGQGLSGGLSFDEVFDAVKNASAPMLEMSMLQGLNDTFENAAYAKNRGESVMGALVTSALTNYVTQIFPTIGGQLERSGEAVRMTTYTDKNGKLPTDVQYTLGKVSQKIPGWDYQQIPYLDAWGREEETGDVLERSINSLFNPAYVSQVDVDKVERELQRVKDATGDSGVFPQRAGRSITVSGEKKDLTSQEYQTYAKTLGRTRYQMVEDGTRLPAYRAMSDGEKAAYIGRLYQYADQQAKAAVSDYVPEAWARNAKAAQRDLGVTPAEYLALYEKHGSEVMSGKAYEKVKRAVSAGLSVDEYVSMKRGADRNGNGTVTKDEAMAALGGRQNRVDLWDLICSTSAKNPYK